MPRLGMDFLIPVLIEEGLPLTKENWLSRASTDSSEESAELMSEMPMELAELQDGEALPVEAYLRAVQELPTGVPPAGQPASASSQQGPETEEEGKRYADLRRLKALRK